MNTSKNREKRHDDMPAAIYLRWSDTSRTLVCSRCTSELAFIRHTCDPARFKEGGERR